MGTSAITGVARGTAAFQEDFSDGDLSSGVLTVTHNLNSQYVSVTVYNNNDLIIIPDDVDAISSTQCTIDLTSYGTISSTPNQWKAIILDKGATASIVHPTPTDLNISGQATNDYLIRNEANTAWEPKSGREKIFVGTLQFGMAQTTQTIGYTGVGFRPTAATFTWSISGGGQSQTGVLWVDDAISATRGIYSIHASLADGWSSSTTMRWDLNPNFYTGAVSSFDVDGFSISWVNSGTTNSTTAVINYTMFR